jgi:Flp pilus assembly protein TadG
VLSPTARPHPPGRRPGNVLALFAIFLTGLVGMVAFAIDTGYIALAKTRMQRTADAAALAGAEMTATIPGQTQDQTAIKNEVKKYVALNSPDLTVRDQDIVLCRYTPYYPAGSRLSYDLSTKPANAVQVTIRRDTTANNPLALFFAPVIGTRSVALAITATAYIMPAAGVQAQAPLLPYTAQANYYYAAMGQPNQIGVDGKKITVADNYTVNPATLVVSSGHDGINEVVLFGDNNTNNANKPGNFGSLDIGSSLNGSGDLTRQILYGPSTSDFTNPDFVFKVNADGSLYVPFTATGDTGLSTTVKTSFEAIEGQPRIIPLYDTVVGSGNTAAYHIIQYAGVVITNVDFSGSPKKLWVQPAFVVSNKVTPISSDSQATTSYGVYTPPKLVIP